MAIVPDTKDWTWVLERACPECGLDTRQVQPTDIPALIRDNAAAWRALLNGAQPGPFPNWDQDATAVAERYGEQDPGTIHHPYDVTRAVVTVSGFPDCSSPG